LKYNTYTVYNNITNEKFNFLISIMYFVIIFMYLLNQFHINAFFLTLLGVHFLNSLLYDQEIVLESLHVFWFMEVHLSPHYGQVDRTQHVYTFSLFKTEWL
jgi:hypothetical protein